MIGSGSGKGTLGALLDASTVVAKSNVYPFASYRILITPLVSEGVYGTTQDITLDVDVTDFVRNFSNVKQQIDNGDYDIGIFTFGNLTLNAININRKFNDENDALSIFPYRRDKAKIEILYCDIFQNEITRFKGLINEDATRLDIKSDTVRFKVLSMDSIFRQVNIPSGAIVAGDLFSTAIKKIINVPAITDVLNFDPTNIVVDLDLTIDNGEVFSNTVVKESLDDLLRASNSILFIDENENVIVSSRAENPTTHSLFGNGDIYGRENILSVKSFNAGIHRVFNSVKVGDTEISTDTAWVSENGFRQKSYSFSFMTDSTKEGQIADRILNNFRVPKMETELVVQTDAIKNARILDLVKVDYNYKLTPDTRDETLPMYGVAQYSEAHYPTTVGSFRILPNIKWKIIGISESAKNFTTILKLRQTGTEANDGVFT